MSAYKEILELINQFQKGYIERDIKNLEDFMNLFADDIEIIGTNGSSPGKDEWYLNKEGVKELVRGDWEDWGDLLIKLDEVRIREKNGVGWITLPGTVTRSIGEENYQSYLEYVKEYIEKTDIPAKQRLHNILRGGTNTVFELNRGEKFVWPIRITAVVVKEENKWKFTQMSFSFSTIYFPDVREF
ncbi:MAG: nuclear transport factor 2 family protein [Sphingobacteriia bacterium]|nr:nuclear transport factor 2 family protein [Sphingobacteriia bacterium]